ncbi:MAG: hypothetical protein KF878_04675 [Planctomycetes bacterium]|nr:hypothetical protein [Planctomycetota bacterium]
MFAAILARHGVLRPGDLDAVAEHAVTLAGEAWATATPEHWASAVAAARRRVEDEFVADGR